MGRIEPVAKLLEPFGRITFSATVEPDEDQTQERKTLLRKFKGISENIDRVNQSLKQFTINIVQTAKLTDIAPEMIAPTEIEQQDHQNTGGIVVAEGDDAQKTAQQNRYSRGQINNQRLVGLFGGFIQVDHPEAD